MCARVRPRPRASHGEGRTVFDLSWKEVGRADVDVRRGPLWAATEAALGPRGPTTAEAGIASGEARAALTA